MKEGNHTIIRIRGSKCKKAWIDCSKQYQRRNHKQVASDIRTAVAFAEDEQFQVACIELTDKETGELL